MAKKNKKEKQNKKINNTSMKAELKKVTWPTGMELLKSTLAVLTIIFFVVLVIFISDTIFTIGTKKMTGIVKNRQEKLKEAEINKDTKTEIKAETKPEEGSKAENKEEKEEKEENKQKENKEENKQEDKKEENAEK